jgi:cytochrome P450
MKSWSITRFDDCVEVDRDHQIYSAEPTVTIGDPQPADRPPPDMFIQTDPPRHDQRRKTVQPAVVPRNLQKLESLIRQRASEILDTLPVGETFDWVSNVGINLTRRMLATLFNFPQEDRGNSSTGRTSLPTTRAQDLPISQSRSEALQPGSAFGTLILLIVGPPKCLASNQIRGILELPVRVHRRQHCQELSVKQITTKVIVTPRESI